MQFTQLQLVPKLTTLGFHIAPTPPDIHARLVDAVRKGIDEWDELPYEGDSAIYGNLVPKFIDIGDLALDVMDELRHLHEQWAGGIRLVGRSSYGVRMYQNLSSLAMHVDKVIHSLVPPESFHNVS